MRKTAKIKVWDVELGLAVHIKAPNGKYIVIDLGSKEGVAPLQSLNYKHVGYMVITHPHHDHFSDIQNIGYAKPDVLWCVKSYSREELMDGVQEKDKNDFEKYCDFCDSYSFPLTVEKDPSLGMPFDGLTAEVFQTICCDKSNKNDFSGIVVVKLGNAKVVVCGDNEKKSLEILMKRDSFKEAIADAYVLIAPHHGRESGYYDDFVAKVRPYLTVISDTSKGTTSVTEMYDVHTRGYSVFNCSTLRDEERKCLTTRRDGNISIEFGEIDDSNYSGYLYVETHV